MSQEQLEERDGESGSEYKEMMSMARAHCQMNGLLEERTRLEEALTRGKPERILRIFRTEVEGMPYDSQQEKADKDLAISVYNFTDEALKKLKENLEDSSIKCLGTAVDYLFLYLILFIFY